MLFTKEVFQMNESTVILIVYMDSDQRKLFRRNYNLSKRNFRNFGDLHFNQMFFGDENAYLPTYEPA